MNTTPDISASWCIDSRQRPLGKADDRTANVRANVRNNESDKTLSSLLKIAKSLLRKRNAQEKRGRTIFRQMSQFVRWKTQIKFCYQLITRTLPPIVTSPCNWNLSLTLCQGRSTKSISPRQPLQGKSRIFVSTVSVAARKKVCGPSSKRQRSRLRMMSETYVSVFAYEKGGGSARNFSDWLVEELRIERADSSCRGA